MYVVSVLFSVFRCLGDDHSVHFCFLWDWLCDVLFSCSFLPVARPYVESVVCMNGCVGLSFFLLLLFSQHNPGINTPGVCMYWLFWPIAATSR
jgi:hypothetical protein